MVRGPARTGIVVALVTLSGVILLWRPMSHRARVVPSGTSPSPEETASELSRLRAEVARLRPQAEAAREIDSLRAANLRLQNELSSLSNEVTALKDAAAESERRILRSQSSFAESSVSDLNGTFHAAAKGPSWGHSQATGSPDTRTAGDIPTAWASRDPDGGTEWLQLKYPNPVDIAEINVHETYNPGAVSRISVIMPDGGERVLWEGSTPAEEAPVETSFPLPAGVRGDQVRVYLDTARVPGWNEIDAVELVGADGSRQWAASSSASSFYGDQRFEYSDGAAAR